MGQTVYYYIAGTHDLQRIEVHRSLYGITVTSELLNGSQATGMFIVVYSLTPDSDIIHYSIHTRLKNQRRIAAGIQDLPGNKYNVSVFTLENGVPFARAAAQPKSVDLLNSKGKNLSGTNQWLKPLHIIVIA